MRIDAAEGDEPDDNDGARDPGGEDRRGITDEQWDRAMAPTNTSSSANPGCRRLSRAGPQLQTMPPTSPRLAAMPKPCLTVGTIVTSANQSSARTEPNQVLRRRSTMTPASCCMQ